LAILVQLDTVPIKFLQQLVLAHSTYTNDPGNPIRCRIVRMVIRHE
jgi:hypothetical protein